ncbi:cysteine desulfurase [Paenibacillus sp. FSL R7-0273]|uniref:aminotransferase class V-fold PLP-dependent enzyme n=1 Tax=Paenibacillus sp. FSL R7-0273 TaxID=1536772 RepID=UPI0004F6857D|nr:aminotransferase class V-fold PLP-dependent enzyme [Paenibacillus sp. FSL R7-0273]AIQ50080.1 cysteine desulfurase [Paenibacillus sp. FSL R7-0273]OMF90952.1 cysteine desulfurase [Paenibacillus sp. FSL R7-0273]
MEQLVYLDHAATSWPKPPEVAAAMMEALERSGANAGRGTHSLAIGTGRVLVRARSMLAELFGVSNAQDIAFTHNTTMGLNMAIKGTLHAGDHVISTMTEHNSVRRPLEYLRRTIGIEVDYLLVDEEGQISLAELKQLFRSATKMVICNHSSNLLGSILPVSEIGKIAKAHNAVYLVDAAQSAGVLEIDVKEMNIDLLAFPGHKGLLGPQGTGGLYISPELELEPLMHGGTGSQSESSEQPDVRPDRYEAGTQNSVGIAGLLAGVRRVKATGINQIHQQEWLLTQQLMEGLSVIPGLRLLGPKIGAPRSGIVSFTIDGEESAAIAHRLDREYHIAVRAGMHCTPLAHKAAATLESGAVRASVGVSSTEHDIKRMLDAMMELYGPARSSR